MVQEHVVAVNELVVDTVNIEVFSIVHLSKDKESIAVLILQINTFHHKLRQFFERCNCVG